SVSARLGGSRSTAQTSACLGEKLPGPATSPWRPGCRAEPAAARSSREHHNPREGIMWGTRDRAWGLVVATAVAVGSGALMASPAGGASFVYVGNAESNDIFVPQLDRQSGDLTLVEKAPIPGIEKPGISTPRAVSPDRRFLYVGTRGEP